MTEEIIWKDPPATSMWRGHKGTYSSWEKRLQPLVDNPNRWALVKRLSNNGNAGAQLSQLKKRSYAIPRPDDGWEFTTRVEDGFYSLYARYLGPTEEGES